MKLAWRNAALVATLVTALIASALGTVYAKHQSRKLFTQLSALMEERDRLEMDWSRLQMEQSTWSAHGRVEDLARSQMRMRNPRPDEVELLAP
jgi:cell division protein FtsL